MSSNTALNSILLSKKKTVFIVGYMYFCRFYGTKSLKVAMSHHLIARTHSCRGDFRAALASEKEAYTTYRQLVKITEDIQT